MPSRIVAWVLAVNGQMRTGRYPRRTLRAAPAAALLVGILASCTPAATPAPEPAIPSAVSSPTPAAASSALVPTGEAAALLGALPVKGRAPRTGYDRALYGQAWADTDRNGCDTRNDILRRDSTDLNLRPGTGGCRVDAGVLHDRYSGTALAYVRGDGQVEIDHVVSLSDAWQKGAQQLSVEQRTAFANDPRNLVATRSDINQAKSDSDAASWLPAHRASRCDLVARQVVVKHDHGLWVTAAERDAMARVLAGCPGMGLPSGTEAPPPAATTPTPRPPTGEVPPLYPNCAAARAAGAAPLHRGERGYREQLDGDNDGIACE